MKSVKEADISPGVRVFVASDLDVPVEKGKITETFRLKELTPTLKYIINKGGFPIIAGHRKQPHGVFDPDLSTSFLGGYFNKELGKGKFELMENLRFDIREEENEPDFAQELAEKADIYVNENFSTSHRNHTSIVGVPQLLPGFAGLRLVEEISHLDSILSGVQKPLVAVVGGAKLESKKPAVKKLLEIADEVLVGGKIGLDWDDEKPSNLILPVDYALEDKDIGEQTITAFAKIISNAKTILWVGPMGMYEDERFKNGTEKVAQSISLATKNGVFSLVGGGDTITALDKFGLLKNFSFVSTGGGAMLKYLVEGTLPGLQALN